MRKLESFREKFELAPKQAAPKEVGAGEAIKVIDLNAVDSTGAAA